MKKWLLFLGIWGVLVGHSWAVNRFPERIPRDFFGSLKQENYAVAWQLLSHHSQQTLLKDILDEAKLPALTLAQLGILMKSNAPILRHTFWQTLRRELPLTLWLRQKYVIEKRQGSSIWVKAVPYQPVYRFLVVQEHNQWKFGLVESFFEKKPLLDSQLPLSAFPDTKPKQHIAAPEVCVFGYYYGHDKLPRLSYVLWGLQMYLSITSLLRIVYGSDR